MDEIPKKGELVQLDLVRIDRNAGKVCKCSNSKKILNKANRQVYCDTCGALEDPFDALVDIANTLSRKNAALERMQEQAEALSAYKPWLKVIRYLEKQYRGKKMLPNCPRCSEPFYLEELTRWMGREFADRRIDHYKKGQENEKH